MSTENDRDVLEDFVVDPSTLGDREHDVRARLTGMRHAIVQEVQRREARRYWRRPLPGPIPVVLNGVPELDPLTFKLELTSPPSDADLARLTDGIARVGMDLSNDDSDHVSFWSEAVIDESSTTGVPAVAWWFDAATASPETVRRLIRELQQLIAATDLKAVRLLIGVEPPMPASD